MPYVENIHELTEHLADLCGIDDQGLCLVGVSDAMARRITDPGTYAHADYCQCRGCWTAVMARRIRAAVSNEALLAQAIPEGRA